MYVSWSKLIKELQNGIEIFSKPSGFQVMDQNSQNIVLIDNRLKHCLAYLDFSAILSSMNNLQ